MYFAPVWRYTIAIPLTDRKGATLGETELQFSKKAERDSAAEEEGREEAAKTGKGRRTW
jgi:hypothetical protein